MSCCFSYLGIGNPLNQNSSPSFTLLEAGCLGFSRFTACPDIMFCSCFTCCSHVACDLSDSNLQASLRIQKFFTLGCGFHSLRQQAWSQPANKPSLVCCSGCGSHSQLHNSGFGLPIPVRGCTGVCTHLGLFSHLVLRFLADGVYLALNVVFHPCSRHSIEVSLPAKPLRFSPL